MNVDDVLKNMPSIKARASEQSEELRAIWQKSKETLKKTEAKVYLDIKLTNPKYTQGQISASVDSNDQIYQKRIDVILFESEYRKKCVEIDKCDDTFTGAKMLAKIQIATRYNLQEGI